MTYFNCLTLFEISGTNTTRLGNLIRRADAESHSVLDQSLSKLAH